MSDERFYDRVGPLTRECIIRLAKCAMIVDAETFSDGTAMTFRVELEPGVYVVMTVRTEGEPRSDEGAM